MKIFLAGASGAIGKRLVPQVFRSSARLVRHPEPGAYNIAEPNSFISTDKARSELGFDAAYRLVVAG